MKYLLILTLMLSGCTTYLVKDKTGTIRVKWSSASVAGFALGVAGVVGGSAISIGGGLENSKGAMVAGGVFGTLGMVSLLVSGFMFGRIEITETTEDEQKTEDNKRKKKRLIYDDSRIDPELLP